MRRTVIAFYSKFRLKKKKERNVSNISFLKSDILRKDFLAVLPFDGNKSWFFEACSRMSEDNTMFPAFFWKNRASLAALYACCVGVAHHAAQIYSRECTSVYEVSTYAGYRDGRRTRDAAGSTRLRARFGVVRTRCMCGSCKDARSFTGRNLDGPISKEPSTQLR